MMRWVGRAAAAIGVLGLSLATGCGNFFVYPGSLTGGGGSSTGDYVYVANANSQSLAAFSVGAGTLTAISGSPYLLNFTPTAVVVNPANTRVFVAGSNGTFGFINTYSIGSGGVLTLMTSNNVASASEVSLDVSPDGVWLVGLDASTGLALNEVIVESYQIDGSSGALKSGAVGIATYTGSQVPGITPLAVKFAPNQNFVFAAVGQAGDLVFQFDSSAGVSSTGVLSLSLGTSPTVSDNALAVSSNGGYLYIARSGPGGGLAVYTIGSGGALNQVNGSPLAAGAGNQPTSVVINKAGTDIYVANQLDTSISGYSISSTGAVAALNPASFTTVAKPRALAVDNSGNYLLSTSFAGTPDLSMYSYDSTLTGKFSTSISTSGSEPAGAISIAATH
jgi:6-phosphogluconolactonase